MGTEFLTGLLAAQQLAAFRARTTYDHGARFVPPGPPGGDRYAPQRLAFFGSEPECRCRQALVSRLTLGTRPDMLLALTVGEC